jgi:hypothetical protein
MVNVVRRTSDLVVDCVMAEGTLTLFESAPAQLTGVDGFELTECPYTLESGYEVIYAETTIPSDWEGGRYTFDNNTWTLV